MAPTLTTLTQPCYKVASRIDIPSGPFLFWDIQQPDDPVGFSNVTHKRSERGTPKSGTQSQRDREVWRLKCMQQRRHPWARFHKTNKGRKSRICGGKEGSLTLTLLLICHKNASRRESAARWERAAVKQSRLSNVAATLFLFG